MAGERARRFSCSCCGLDARQQWPTFNEQTGIAASKVVRTLFQLRCNAHSNKYLDAPNTPAGAGTVMLSGNWPQPLTFTQGVVPFSYRSYNPDKRDTGVIDSTTCFAPR
jgi:hypothetical protein